MQTRLRKLDEGECDATLLALAGLKRLSMADKATAIPAVTSNRRILALLRFNRERDSA